MYDLKRIRTPMNSSSVTTENDDDALDNGGVTKFESIVKSLLHIRILTAPDVGVAISLFNTHVEVPLRINMLTIKRAIKYLKRTAERPLVIELENLDGLVD